MNVCNFAVIIILLQLKPNSRSSLPVSSLLHLNWICYHIIYITSSQITNIIHSNLSMSYTSGKFAAQAKQVAADDKAGHPENTILACRRKIAEFLDFSRYAFPSKVDEIPAIYNSDRRKVLWLSMVSIKMSSATQRMTRSM